jgi:putative DNA primase/helicase
VIRGNDPAIWSRLKLIPFETSFEGREDKSLKQDLLSELPGILAWAVEGCLQWQREGLAFPASVLSATQEHRNESDMIDRFVEDRCVKTAQASAQARTLYDAYRQWAERSGEAVLNETTFGTRLRDRGFAKVHSRGGTVYQGIGLLQTTGS